LVKTWQQAAARIPELERRVKTEALQGRLANKIPPAQAWAIYPATGLPDVSAGPSEEYDRMSLPVFDAKMSTGLETHPATKPPPQPKPGVDVIDENIKAKAAKLGVSPEIYLRAERKWKD